MIIDYPVLIIVAFTEPAGEPKQIVLAWVECNLYPDVAAILCCSRLNWSDYILVSHKITNEE